jgi:hypothetical protein
VAKKAVAKKTSTKSASKHIQAFKEAKKNLKDLELGLTKLKKQVEGLCQHPYVSAPKPPNSD